MNPYDIGPRDGDLDPPLTDMEEVVIDALTNWTGDFGQDFIDKIMNQIHEEMVRVIGDEDAKIDHSWACFPEETRIEDVELGDDADELEKTNG